MLKTRVLRRLVSPGPSSVQVALDMAARVLVADAGRPLAALASGLLVLVGVAAAIRAAPGLQPAVVLVTVVAAISLGASLVGTRLRPARAVVAVVVTTLFSEVTFPFAPTVVWLFALVIPAVGMIHGSRSGALAGFVAAPAIHWIETGVALDLLDPQTPFGVLILVVIGATPGYLLDLARTRGDRLNRELDRAAGLVRETEQARQDEAAARRQAVFMLARAAEARDGTTGIHIEHVSGLASGLAAAIGLPPDQVDEIGWSAMLHDVGKIRVPDRVLLKPSRLNDEEWALIRQHPIWGEELLKGDEGFALARQIARWHHEDWDGSGYPDGLRREAIPLAARIVRIADVYDALRSHRPYKPAWSHERTLETLAAMSGRGLDPELTSVFLRLPNHAP
jgi:hypothetical protein